MDDGKSNNIQVGTNRTGIALARERTEAMLSDTEDLLTDEATDPNTSAVLRAEYCVNAEPIGTMSPPTSFKGMAKSAMLSSSGGHPMVFMDKLGERLAFEKGGTRLYEMLLMKHDAFGSFPGGPERAELEEILEEEAEHHRLLQAAIESLAGDPTALTPSADLSAVASHGIFAVLADPRAGLLQSLEAIAIAEMTDNDGWEVLVELADAAGEPALRETFLQARADEADHLARVRAWIAAGQGRKQKARSLELKDVSMPSFPAAPSVRAAKKVAKKKAAGKAKRPRPATRSRTKTTSKRAPVRKASRRRSR